MGQLISKHICVQQIFVLSWEQSFKRRLKKLKQKVNQLLSFISRLFTFMYFKDLRIICIRDLPFAMQNNSPDSSPACEHIYFASSCTKIHCSNNIASKTPFPIAMHMSKADERRQRMHETRKLPRKLNKFPIKVVTNTKKMKQLKAKA